MKLSRYLETHRTTPAEFARRISVPASTITRLLSGERSPGLALLQTIHVATGGHVTPNDFLPDAVVAEVPVAAGLPLTPTLSPAGRGSGAAEVSP